VRGYDETRDEVVHQLIIKANTIEVDSSSLYFSYYVKNMKKTKEEYN
jgi:hypothetical protein